MEKRSIKGSNGAGYSSNLNNGSIQNDWYQRFSTRTSPTSRPFGKFRSRIVTDEPPARLRDIPTENPKEESGGIFGFFGLSSSKPKAPELPKIDRSFANLRSDADNAIGRLYLIATGKCIKFKWNIFNTLADEYLYFKGLASDEGFAGVSLKEFAYRHVISHSQRAPQDKYTAELLTKLSELPFNEILDSAILQYAQFIIKNKKDDKLLEELWNALAPKARSEIKDDLNGFAALIDKQNEDELAAYLKENLLSVLIIQYLRSALLTGGINPDIEIKGLDNDGLKTLCLLLGSHNFGRSIAQYHDPRLYTSDIATALSTFTTNTQKETFFRLTRKLKDNLRDFIDSKLGDEKQLRFEELKPLLAQLQDTVNSLVEFTVIPKLGDTSNNLFARNVIKVILSQFAPHQQRVFLSRLDPQELYYFLFVDFIFNSTAREADGPLNKLNQEIKNAIRIREIAIKGEEQKGKSLPPTGNMRLNASEAARRLLVDLIKMEIALMASDTSSTPLATHLRNVYSRLKGKAALYWQTLVENGAIPRCILRSGANYPVAIMAVAFSELLDEAKDTLESFNTYQAVLEFLSIDQLIELKSTDGEVYAQLIAQDFTRVEAKILSYQLDAWITHKRGYASFEATAEDEEKKQPEFIRYLATVEPPKISAPIETGKAISQLQMT